MGPEAKIQAKIIAYLKSLPDVWLVKVIQCNINGVPDILVCHRGRFVAIEVKSDTGRLSPLQRVQIDRINAAGGLAFVARSVEDVKAVVY